MFVRKNLLLLALLCSSASLFAQQEEKDASLDKILAGLSKLRISAYIQGQYQYGQKDATLRIGDSNEDPEHGFNRIGIRRGRLRVEYNDGIGTGAIQIDAGENGVGFRDLYMGVKDPWTHRNSLTAGIFNRPFGYEVGYSSARRESPERATIIQTLFPNERDVGAMLSLQAAENSPLAFLHLDAGIFAGNGISRETDSRKDFIGRLGAEKDLNNWGAWGLGVSYYNGSVYNPTTEAYEMEGTRFVKVVKEKTGTFMKREYIGFDARFSLKSSIGRTTLRAEGLFGTQPGIAGSSRSPSDGTRPENLPENALYKRPFAGYFFYFIQDIGTTPFSFVLKYDTYDPNTDVEEDEAGVEGSFTTKTDLAQSTIGIGALYSFSQHILVQAFYEINRNEESKHIAGYESNRKDNVLTIRMQYRF